MEGLSCGNFTEGRGKFCAACGRTRLMHRLGVNAEQLKEMWFKAFPETQRYFKKMQARANLTLIKGGKK